MASTISSWYHNQYSTWNRTRRMQAPPYLARVESPTSRITRAAAAGGGGTPQPGDAVINMGDLLPPQNSQSPDKKKQDTLFGPSIGIVNPGPDWADHKLNQSEKAQLQDVLTPELVKSWVEKSKEASQPTTTLQALVNLKRPSLRLSPISHDQPENDAPSLAHHHGFEFQFDCDAPKCGISLRVMSAKEGNLVEVFRTVVEGGFGRVLKLEEGATLELDKFDPSAQPRAALPTPTAETHTDAEPGPAASEANAEAHHHKKRFTLRIRKRTHPHAVEDTNRVSVAGPALEVVDVETPSDGATAEAKEKNEDGVKVLIKLEALDANEHTLASPNSQATYLHIVRLGAAPASDAPDTRPWVVRVVKREATIGPHTFHLHEIYGLTSHAPASGPETHTYPPTAADADDPTSECLLCLSSPREVVLLPCRHLVACKECAVNMVEFGAGGQLVHTDDAAGDANTNGGANAATAAPGETPGEGSGAAAGTTTTTGALTDPAQAPTTPRVPAPAPAQPRRKRKAKGWFCPVCRQPYTSLLRISTTAPPSKAKELEGGGVTMPAPPSPAVLPPAAESPNASRPGFLRVISNAAARVTGSEGNNNARAEAV